MQLSGNTLNKNPWLFESINGGKKTRQKRKRNRNRATKKRRTKRIYK